MATITVNGKDIQIGDHEPLNLVEAAGRAGVYVPHYCWHPALSVVASCRMCLVEVGDRQPDGSVRMQPKVVPACQTPAKNGTVVVTDSPKAKLAQQQTLEGLLLNHPLDCPVCDKAGECFLQDYSFRYGKAESRMIDEKFAPPNKPDIGRDIVLFTDRCIKCSRCVRFTREISGTAELQFIHRGEHEEIDIFPGEPCDNKLAGNVVDLCPVGALCSKDFLYKQRVWFLQSQPSVCPDCSTGCSIHVNANKDIVYRLQPRTNPQAQGYFMCDDGRLGYHYANSKERLVRAELRQDGGVRHPHYEDLVRLLRDEFKEAAARAGGGVAGVLSPFLTCEEAYLLARFFKGLSPHTRLALGPVPVRGEDDTYPKDRRGRPMQPVQFTIRAEKCPNRLGVEAILRHFQGEIIRCDDILWAAGEGKLHAVYIAAGYPPREGGWITAEQATGLGRVPLLVVHDLFPSSASAVAKYVLPAATFAEKDGCFVNHAGLAQAIRRAVRPPRDFRSDGQVFLDLMERRGLLHAATLRAELAKEVPFFAALGSGDLDEHGVFVGK
jgi:NADH-quinone oxidoreductase subunit G